MKGDTYTDGYEMDGGSILDEILKMRKMLTAKVKPRYAYHASDYVPKVDADGAPVFYRIERQLAAQMIGAMGAVTDDLSDGLILVHPDNAPYLLRVAARDGYELTKLRAFHDIEGQIGD